jgi:hypothetical protein
MIMKTLLTFALAGLLATSSFAANENLMALSSVNANFKHINVTLKDGVGKAKIAILNEDGKILHQRSLNVKKDLMIPYNLDQMPCGEYQVKISTDDDELTYTVETFEKETMPIEYPLMAYGRQIDYDTINLTVVGLDDPGVDVKIRMENGHAIIYQELVTQPEGFIKAYKLKGISPQDVYFEVKDVLGRTRILHF